MGHKVHPIGFRLGVIRDWDAKWYADRHYMEYLQEDIKLRGVVESMYPEAGVSTVEIDRQANNVAMTIHTARPGILIGRGGQRVDELRAKLEALVGKRVQLNIREVAQPELDAYLVARNVADQIERRLAYRRTLKQAILRSMQAGAKGMRISCAGRLDGAEIARRVTMHEGQVPLHTLRADIDYGFTEARTTMGRIGVKVWLYRGDVLPARKETEEEAISEAMMPTTAPSDEETAVEATAFAPEVPTTTEPEVVEPVAIEATEQLAGEVAEVEVVAEVIAEAEVAVEAEEKPVAKKRTRKATPKAEAAAEATTEAPVEAEAEVAVEAEEKPVAKRRTRKATPKAESAAEATTEAPVEAEAEVAVEAEEKPAAKRRTRKATPKAESAAEATTEAPVEAEVGPVVEAEEKPPAKKRTRKATPKTEATAESTTETPAESDNILAESQGDSDAAA